MDLLAVPMLFQASKEFAASFGDPILDDFLRQLPGGDCVIDTRSHLLQIGMYPCIPGWHLDNIKRVDGVIQINHPDNTKLEHYVMFHGVAPTRILRGSVSVNFHSWEEADKAIERAIEDKWFEEYSLTSGVMHRLPWDGYHRGTAATEAGRRCFMRATFGSGITPKNEVRHQTQVYVPLNYGW